jgi:chromatin remodeling complex protein RSC6
MVVYSMAKANKSASKAPAKSTSAPAVEKPVESKSTKSTKSTKPKVKSEPVVAAPVVVENTKVATTENTEVVLNDAFSEFMAKFQTLISQMNALKADFRNLEKKATKELKAAQKLSSKRKRKSGNRSPSGFVKPTLISSELANFLKKPLGTEMARTDVTREINGYIRANNLQDKQNGRKINPDQHLATLLKIGTGEELTYFNLQRYMSPHFAKAGAQPEAETNA